LSDQPHEPRCKRCHRDTPRLARADSFDRIALADDPADPNCGHYYLEAVCVMQCPAAPPAEQVSIMLTTLREAQEMDAHCGKG
jgi:hypothetical protein